MSASVIEGGTRPVRRDPWSQERARTRANALAGELRLLGFTTVVHRRGDHHQHPCVEVRSGLERRAHITEYVYAAPEDPLDESGAWQFWWSALVPVGPLGDVAGAAKGVARELTCPGADCRECSARIS